jgi:hypothetical protein
MIKRKTIAKKTREAVYQKYAGHCAYCGEKIDYKDMQIDHLIPVQRERFKRFSEEEIECFENYMPACRKCNHYKRAHSLEVFRKMIEEIPKKLDRDSYIYRIGRKYNLIVEWPQSIKFYFELVKEKDNEEKNNA